MELKRNTVVHFILDALENRILSFEKSLKKKLVVLYEPCMVELWMSYEA